MLVSILGLSGLLPMSSQVASATHAGVLPALDCETTLGPDLGFSIDDIRGRDSDQEGNIYFAIQESLSAGNTRGVLVKFDRSCNLLWTVKTAPSDPVGAAFGCSESGFNGCRFFGLDVDAHGRVLTQIQDSHTAQFPNTQNFIIALDADTGSLVDVSDEFATLMGNDENLGPSGVDSVETGSTSAYLLAQQSQSKLHRLNAEWASEYRVNLGGACCVDADAQANVAYVGTVSGGRLDYHRVSQATGAVLHSSSLSLQTTRGVVRPGTDAAYAVHVGMDAEGSLLQYAKIDKDTFATISSSVDVTPNQLQEGGVDKWTNLGGYDLDAANNLLVCGRANFATQIGYIGQIRTSDNSLHWSQTFQAGTGTITDPAFCPLDPAGGFFVGGLYWQGGVLRFFVRHYSGGGFACPVPTAPQNLVASPGPGGSQIGLTWERPACEGATPLTHYTVLRADAGSGPYAPIAQPVGTSFVDSVGEVRPYYYLVRASDANGQSPDSNLAGAVPPGTPLGTDNFDVTDYQPESPTGNTPLGGASPKAPIPVSSQARSGSVNLAKGEFVATFPILQVDNQRGSPFSFELTFRSIGNPSGNKSMSWRWDANWLQHLEADGSDFLHFTGDGRVHRYVLGASGHEGPPGTYAKLLNVSGKWELQDREGNRRVFDPAKDLKLADVFDAAGNRWALNYASGDGRLESLVDPHGRTITFSYASSASTTSNPFYALNHQPILTGIADFAGRSAELQYDVPTGRLVALKTPAAATGTQVSARFTYDAANRLILIRDALGADNLRLLYDAQGRTVSQIRGAASGHFFQYYHDAGITLEWDGNSNKDEWRFAAPRVVPASKIEHTRGLRATDASSYTTQYAFNAQDEVTSIAYPAGNGATFVYDEAGAFFSRGNLLRETRTPGTVRTLRDEANFQSSIVTDYQYDANFNVATKIIDARGTDPLFVPPNGGAATPARYTTRVFYDFEESTLGDLNGDGITSQAARRPVKIEYPKNNPAGAPHAAFTAAYANQTVAERFVWNAQGQLVKHKDPAGVEATRTYYATGPSTGYLQSETVDSAAGGLALATNYAYNSFGEIIQVTDPANHVRQFQVDQRGRVAQETGPSPTGYRTKWTYDADDNVLSMARETDANTNTYATRTYAYDSVDRLLTETVDASRSSTIQSAIANQGATTPTTYHIQYAYDGNDHLVKRTGGTGEIHEWRFDERDLLLFESGPDGGTHSYDANGNPATHVDPLGQTTRFQHDGYDRPSVRIDAHGNVFVRNFDVASNAVRERGFQGGPVGPLLFERLYFHDEANQAYRMDAWHEVPAGNSKAPTAATLTPNDNWVTSLEERDVRGLVTRRINDNAHVTTREYDNAGRLKNTTDPVGNSVSPTYDANGNVIQTTERDVDDAGGNPETFTTSYAFDSENRPTQVTNPDLTTRVFTLDGRGNVVKVVDEALGEVQTLYDHADRPWLVRQKVNATTNIDTTTHWDGEDRPVKRCDGTNQCTAYTYVPATGLVASETPATLPAVVHTYDAAGNLRTTTFPASGKQATMGYDALNRRTTVDISGMPLFSGTTRQTYTYDAMGRVLQATDDGIGNLGLDVRSTQAILVAQQEFDTLGRTVAETQLGLRVRHALDGVGNVASSTYPSLDLRVVSRTYDPADRLDKVTDAKGLIADYSYHGSRVASKAFGGPATGAAPTARTTFEYDAMRRPTVIEHKDGPGAVLAGFQERYDVAGNRVAQQAYSAASPAATNPHSQLFGFDARYRTNVWKRGPINAALDAIPTPVEETTWSDINARNDWASWSPQGPGASRPTCTRTSTLATTFTETCVTTMPNSTHTTTYVRDANGNLLDDGKYVYRWDFDNRLVRVDEKTGPGTTRFVVAYGYDAFDRRVIKGFPENLVGGIQGTQEGWYTFAGPHVVQESKPLKDVATGNVTGFHVIRQWTYGPGIDEALEMSWDKNGDQVAIGAADARFFYHYDPLGTVVGLTNEAGTLVEGYAYQPYGNVTILVPAVPGTSVRWDGTDAVSVNATGKPLSPSGNLWYFTGRQYDPEIGSYNYRARQYHPGLGQFMNLDPIGVWGDPLNLGNPYAYVGNNPSTWRDPLGLWSRSDNRALLCEGGSALAFAFLPGVGLGCAAGRDYASDQRVFNEGWNLDYALSPLDAIPAGSGAKAGTKAAIFGFGFALRHGDEAAQAAKGLKAVNKLEEPADFLMDWSRKSVDDAFKIATKWGHRIDQPPGITMLGHYPEYALVAKQKGFRYFEVPPEHWNRLGKNEQWKANERFLDRGIVRGDEHVLSGPVREGPSDLRKEIEYLATHGIRPHIFDASRFGRF